LKRDGQHSCVKETNSECKAVKVFDEIKKGKENAYTGKATEANPNIHIAIAWNVERPDIKITKRIIVGTYMRLLISAK